MTKRTLREIAEAMYARFCLIEHRNGRTDMPPWPDLNEKAQAEWFELAEAGSVAAEPRQTWRGLLLFVIGAAVGTVIGAVIGSVLAAVGFFSSHGGAMYCAGFIGGLFAVKFEERWFAGWAQK